jgi:predicted transcriptional regulator of viral defense system
MISGISKKNKIFLDSLAINWEKPFSIQDTAELLHLPKEKVRITLAHLVRKSWLARIKSSVSLCSL